MTTLDSQFVPYDLSLKLKELGFNEECFGFYDDKYNKDNGLYLNSILNADGRYIYTKAPLWQQAFNFIREKYDIQCWLHDGGMIGKTFIKITGYKHDKFYFSSSEPMEYEKAQQECLKELIKIAVNEK